MTQLEQLCINTVRTLAMDAVEKATCGHPGTPMALAPLGYVLYRHVLRHSPRNPDWPVRDRFVLSCGHASMLLYSYLHLTGYDLSREEIKNFRQWGSKTPGHPEYGHTPGVEVTTGPLGQGFGAAVGMAVAQKWMAARFNRPGHEIFDYRIYVVCSDGDMMEGIASEAASLAGHLRLSNITAIYDDNHITIDGNTSLSFSEDVCRRFESYGWSTQHLEDANDLEAIGSALSRSQSSDRPSFIRLRSHIGYGSPNKQDTAAAHGSVLGAEEVALTKKNLGWPYEEPFTVPDEVYAEMRNTVDEGTARYEAWQTQFASYQAAFPAEAGEYLESIAGRLPDGWDAEIPTFGPEKGMATRVASGNVLTAIASRLPNLIGGSGDLAGSTNTTVKGSKDFEADSYDARTMHFGIREHAMGGVLHGMALTPGVIPYGSTFFVFSDYMRPPIRLAALSGVRFIMLYTHDSIGLGEDGPTHQPVEHLAAMRAVPNCLVIRPCDANETAEAWRIALEHRSGPVLLILTRQSVPTLDRSVVAPASGLQNGGYVLADFGTGRPKVILISTGSEIHPTLAAAQRLADGGVAARVVSMPCWRLFDQQPRDYRDCVLPPSITKRVAVEAASPLGWERYIGLEGKTVCIDKFGASAPVEILMQEYGFTPENIAATAMSLLTN